MREIVNCIGLCSEISWYYMVYSDRKGGSQMKINIACSNNAVYYIACPPASRMGLVVWENSYCMCHQTTMDA